MRQAAREVLDPATADVHWQAEWHRWFGDEFTPGLLPAWLNLERQRLAQGWRWRGVEVAFAGLARPGWPFTLKGRLDRLDFHPETGELIVWDYKTGTIPNGAQVFERREESQLPGYLWAVREGHTDVDLGKVEVLTAGFIGLKSSGRTICSIRIIPAGRISGRRSWRPGRMRWRAWGSSWPRGTSVRRPARPPPGGTKGPAAFAPMP